jgi:hypothetical protein
MHITPSIRSNVASKCQGIGAVALLGVLDSEIRISSAVHSAVLDGHVCCADVCALESTYCCIVGMAVEVGVCSYCSGDGGRRSA